ncbi:MAG: isoleucine--tRNA ligase [Treponemataceae bacterium]|nr:MAG: isoleucine--tRNA ligase [Treponemataceae bacterium]
MEEVYSPVDPKSDLAKNEEAVLAFWQKNDIFKKSIEQRKDAEEFVFYDGPPFATGLPHFGHFIPCTIKDIIPRYQTMRGKRVERRFGWDCHGLPVENLIEKELGLNSKTDIEKYGVEKFNEACRKSVLRYVNEWEKTITRLGRWVDFKNDYKTMDSDYMESIWWIMKQLWDKGLLYEGSYILPYCPRCSTVLSNHELNMGGYKDVHDPAVTVRFTLTAEADTHFLAWTTTPWTLPSNLGLTVGPDIDYVKIRDGNECYILAESRLGAYYPAKSDKSKSESDKSSEYSVIWKKKGAELAGMTYEPLFPYFAELAQSGAFQVRLGDFVSTEDGTGIVHTAPGFGEDDYNVFKGSAVPAVCPIDAECKFTAEVSDYQGRFVKECDKDIIERLKKEGKLVRRDQILHSYPHCWRCGSPLIYRGIGSWFVGVESLREKLLAANAQITWQPAHIKNGRFGKWLEGARDWAVSRNRYWGNPIPVWKCDTCGKTICIGSRDELKAKSGVYAEDLHKHFVDKITFTCDGEKDGKPCDGTMHRVPEVLDCWFESGAMPYAQNHYPFENKAYFEAHYPSDFISEGLDQTRGWFYTLTVLAAALFERPAFKNCIVSGLVLAADGKKMSKSINNYTDPALALNQFGADAIRLFLMQSSVTKAEDLKYSDEGVRDVIKGILLPLWNSYSFFVTYANIDGIKAAGIIEKDGFDMGSILNPLDTWLISVTQKLIRDVTCAFDSYDLPQAIEQIVFYIELLNNWYIRRSRRRFWKSSAPDGSFDSDKYQAYETLYYALKTFALVACPVIPFITETMWRNVRAKNDAQSVHLADFPCSKESLCDSELEFKMASVQKAVSMGRSLRYQYNLKIRQPLSSAEFVTRNEAEKRALLEMEEIIRDELNVKKIVFHEREEELVEYRAKANFRTLGKELGQKMKAASEIIASLDQDSIASLLEGSVLSIDVEGQTIELSQEKIIVERIEKAALKVINEGTLTAALDTLITDDLKKEGFVRDLIRGIQNMRKDSGLSVTDRITIELFGSPELKSAYTVFGGFIASETLALKIDWLGTDAAAGNLSVGFTEIEAGTEKWLARIAAAAG